MNIRPNGRRIRELRNAKGFTQETLATLSKVTGRTIQRAERSEIISHETLADIAAALDVRSLELHLHDPDIDNTGQEETSGIVVLHRTNSAREVVQALQRGDSHAFVYDVEPTDENVDAMVELFARLEIYAPPWSRNVSPWEATRSVPETIREIAALNKSINLLESCGVYVFLGEYVASGKKLRWDPDEYCWSHKIHQVDERLRAVVIHLSKTGAARVTHPVDDRWSDPVQRETNNLALEDASEIPF